ncbi:MAG: hypothetical protein HY782_08580 [Chloroflexi bacterium]|nr:hypothetical protein [Chloroflexota bacterium]
MDTHDPFAPALAKMLALCQAQYGDAIKTYWFHNAELCPCCGKRRVAPFKYKHKDALSLNAFIYRAKGVLIGYTLCGICAADVLNPSNKRQAMMHDRIEKNLVEAYHKHMSHVN